MRTYNDGGRMVSILNKQHKDNSGEQHSGCGYVGGGLDFHHEIVLDNDCEIVA